MQYSRYIQEPQRFKGLRPDMNSVDSYGWHGTRADNAQAIAKYGFDISKVKSMYNALLTLGSKKRKYDLKKNKNRFTFSFRYILE